MNKPETPLQWTLWATALLLMVYSVVNDVKLVVRLAKLARKGD